MSRPTVSTANRGKRWLGSPVAATTTMPHRRQSAVSRLLPTAASASAEAEASRNHRSQALFVFESKGGLATIVTTVRKRHAPLDAWCIDAERAHLAQARQELERAGRWAAEAGDEVGGAEVDRVRALVAYKEGDLDSAVLAAECAALSALALKRLGRAPEAEERRAEAEAGFRSLGAQRLLEHLAENWRAAPGKRRPSGPPTKGEAS